MAYNNHDILVNSFYLFVDASTTFYKWYFLYE